MRQSTGTRKSPGEKLVKDIKRATPVGVVKAANAGRVTSAIL